MKYKTKSVEYAAGKQAEDRTQKWVFFETEDDAREYAQKFEEYQVAKITHKICEFTNVEII